MEIFSPSPWKESFGRLTRRQQHALRPHLPPLVYDLGAGSGELSRVLARLGGSRVVAVDKDPFPSAPARGVEHRQCLFRDITLEPGAAVFLSWPVTTFDRELVLRVIAAPLIIYLGSNFDGTACGSVELWCYLRHREVLVHEPHWKNTLIVYGPRSGSFRPMLIDEIAGVSSVVVPRPLDEFVWRRRHSAADADALEASLRSAGAL